MSAQRTLFDPPHANGSDTSRAAADSIRGSAASQRRRVLAFIRSCGERGTTDDEGQQATGLDGDSYRARRWALEKQGLVVRDDDTERVTRRGGSAHPYLAKGVR